ncbi:periplasmic heavy metal sensor [Celeribacter sp.]|uniref:periplasmic heavy metal sensor n=1 Tax=Celeribacter sp. TaxID=1890673 RepID=UPI003A90A37D
MSELEQTPPQKGTFHWSRVVLVVSLALNLAVVGMVAGAALRRDDGARGDGERVRVMQTRDFGFGPYVGAFEGKDKRELGRAFMEKAGGRVEARKRVEAQFNAVMAALRAEPFDPSAFEAVIVEQQADLAARQEIGARLLAQKVANMTHDERAAYAKRLDEMVKRGPQEPPKDGPHKDGKKSDHKDGPRKDGKKD